MPEVHEATRDRGGGWEGKSRSPEKRNTALGDLSGQQSWEDTLPTYEGSLVSGFIFSPTNQSLISRA